MCNLQILFCEDADRVLVSLVAFKNLEDYMPPETTDVDIRQHSVAALRYHCWFRHLCLLYLTMVLVRNTNEIVPTANIISASIVATSDGAKYRRNYQPLHLSNASAVYINYTLEVCLNLQLMLLYMQACTTSRYMYNIFVVAVTGERN